MAGQAERCRQAVAAARPRPASGCRDGAVPDGRPRWPAGCLCGAGLRFVAGSVHQPHEGHDVAAAAEGGVGVDGAVVVFLHAVMGDEPRLHLVAVVLGGTQVLFTAGIGTAEATDDNPRLTLGDELAVLGDELAVVVYQLRGITDGAVVAFERRIEHEFTGHEAEKNDRIGLLSVWWMQLGSPCLLLYAE